MADVVDDSGRTPLMTAIARGNIATVLINAVRRVIGVLGSSPSRG